MCCFPCVDPPMVTLSIEPRSVMEGERVTFTCHATANPPIMGYRSEMIYCYVCGTFARQHDYCSFTKCLYIVDQWLFTCGVSGPAECCNPNYILNIIAFSEKWLPNYFYCIVFYWRREKHDWKWVGNKAKPQSKQLNDRFLSLQPTERETLF